MLAKYNPNWISSNFKKFKSSDPDDGMKLNVLLEQRHGYIKTLAKDSQAVNAYASKAETLRLHVRKFER